MADVKVPSSSSVKTHMVEGGKAGLAGALLGSLGSNFGPLGRYAGQAVGGASVGGTYGKAVTAVSGLQFFQGMFGGASLSASGGGSGGNHI